jgi:hypothetical protein
MNTNVIIYKVSRELAVPNVLSTSGAVASIDWPRRRRRSLSRGDDNNDDHSDHHSERPPGAFIINQAQ